MIAEDLLERGLADAATAYDVPPDAVDHIREQLAPSVEDDGVPARRWQLHRPTTRGWLALAAAVIVAVVALSFAVGGGTGSDRIEHDLAVTRPAASPASDGGGSAGSTAGGFTKITNGTDKASTAHVPLAAPSPVSATGDRAVRAIPHVPALPGAATSGSAGSAVGAGSSTGNGPIAPVPSAPDRIIKTGELDLQVPKGQVSTTLDRLTGIATLVRGYVADSRTSEGGFAPSGQVTLRVPVAAFEDTISRARKIPGVRVLALETSGKDVTSTFVDLKARINALDATRKTFLTLLTKATTIGETLAVQQHITDVQTQIEQLQGEKKVLVNRSALSTLTVTVDQKVVTHTTRTHHKSGLTKAVDRSVSRFVHGIEAIIGVIGPLLLIALIAGLGWLAARFSYRRLRRRMV